MKLIDQTKASLCEYLVAQISNLIPDGRGQSYAPLIAKNLDEALDRIQHCIDGVKMWRPGEFNYLHSSQYCIFLYYLANTIWKNTSEPAVPTRLFLVNKALNGIDLFYEIAMPKIFFIGHSAGIVLAKATYGEHLVLYQNSTVGKSGGDAPVIGDRVIIHPNCAVIGRSRIADGTILSQGTSVINRETLENHITYAENNGALTFRTPRQNIIEDFFRL